MKKPIMIILVLLSWSTLGLADTHQSPFGFSLNIPSHWLILSSEEVKKNPDLFDFQSDIFKNIDKSILEQLKGMVVSGRVEIYYNQRTTDASFNDNINVYKRVGQLPQNASESKRICEGLPGQLSAAYGKSIKVYSCGSRRIAGLNAFYVEFDGVMDGTRSMMYEVEKSPSVIIAITATCKNRTLPTIKKEFEEMVASIKME